MLVEICASSLPPTRGEDASPAVCSMGCCFVRRDPRDLVAPLPVNSATSLPSSLAIAASTHLRLDARVPASLLRLHLVCGRSTRAERGKSTRAKRNSGKHTADLMLHRGAFT